MVLVDTYETSAPVDGKQVPLYPLSTEQLQANLPPPSSLKKPPISTEVHAPFDKLPDGLPKTHLWLEQHFIETVDFNKGPAMMESWRSAFGVLHQASLKPDALGGLPLVILTRENVSEEERRQPTGHLQLSRSVKPIVAVHSGHYIQLERPDLVSGAVKDVLSERSASH